jgi:sugar phosphate isomerase/epimerase
MKTKNQIYFEASCKYHKIPISLGNKIIDGRYKPFLSALDDKNYDGSTVWDAKYEALNEAISKFGIKKTILKLKKLS